MLTRLEWRPPEYTGDAKRDWDRLTKSLKDYHDDLQKKGALDISQARINGTPIGETDPDTGAFDSINVGAGGVLSIITPPSTYTPTLTGVANLDGVTPYTTAYFRLGSCVVGWGKFDANPAVAATLTQFGMSLPVASNFAAEEDAGGVAFARAVAGQGAAIYADTTNDRLMVEWTSSDLANRAMSFIFAYRIR
jgi:hypothetical protein